MKKIDILVKGRKLSEKLFGTKKKGIKLALETAKNELEQKKGESESKYEDSLIKLADDNVNYKYLINQMIEHKQTVYNAEETIKLIDSIKEDLNSEIDE